MAFWLITLHPGKSLSTTTRFSWFAWRGALVWSPRAWWCVGFFLQHQTLGSEGPTLWVLLWSLCQPPTFTSGLLFPAIYALASRGSIGQMPCSIFVVYFAKCGHHLRFWSMRDLMDVFLSVKSRNKRPEIVSPANETIEVVLGKWATIRICWNQYLLHSRLR